MAHAADPVDDMQNKPQRDPEAVTRFVERFAQVLVDSGVSRISSRIFSALLASDDGRLTAGELAERLQASAGAISGGVRYLLQVGMVTREREPGSRRDHYRVDDDVWYRLISERDQVLGRWAASLRDGAEVLGPGTPAGGRMGEAVEFFAFLQSELRQMVHRWDEHRASGGAPPG